MDTTAATALQTHSCALSKVSGEWASVRNGSQFAQAKQTILGFRRPAGRRAAGPGRGRQVPEIRGRAAAQSLTRGAMQISGRFSGGSGTSECQGNSLLVTFPSQGLRRCQATRCPEPEPGVLRGRDRTCTSPEPGVLRVRDRTCTSPEPGVLRVRDRTCTSREPGVCRHHMRSERSCWAHGDSGRAVFPRPAHRSLRSPSSHGLRSGLGTGEAQDRREESVGSLSWSGSARGSLSPSRGARPRGKFVMGETGPEGSRRSGGSAPRHWP